LFCKFIDYFKLINVHEIVCEILKAPWLVGALLDGWGDFKTVWSLWPPDLAILPKIQLGTFYVVRDVNFNMEVAITTEYCQPCSVLFYFISSRKDLFLNS